MEFSLHPNGTCTIDKKTYPAVGFGTYPLKGIVCTQAILKALQVGYRIIDTATFYKNFFGVEEGIHRHPREELYIISKVWYDEQTPEKLENDLLTALQLLELEYLDAYFLHWPNSQVSLQETLAFFEQARRRRYIRHIGLSNITAHHLRKVLMHSTPISWVQIEMHPLFYDPELLALCTSHGIVTQAWTPLGRGKTLDNPLLIELAKKYTKSPAQISLRWIIQHGCIPIPGSTNEQHMQENMAIFDFALTEEEMERINEQAKKGSRKRITPERGLGFSDEFDFTYEQCWPKG